MYISSMPVRSQFPDVPLSGQVSLWQYVQVEAARYMDRTYMVDGRSGEEVSFVQFFDDVKKIAGGFWHDLGMRKGDILMIYAANNIGTPKVLMAAASVGVVVTMCNHMYGQEELEDQMRDSAATHIVSTPDLLPAVKAATKKYKNIQNIILYGADAGEYRSLESLMSLDQRSAPWVPISPTQDILWIPYSSGTTGKPKGVLLTHHNTVANHLQLAHPSVTLDADPNPGTYVMFVPMFHVYALNVIVHALTHGKTMVIMDKFDVQRYLQLIQEHKTSVLFTVPPVVTLLARHPMVEQYDLSCVHTVLCGAAPLSLNLEQQVKARLSNNCTVEQGWGLTEITMGATRNLGKPGSVGPPIPNTLLKVVDVETGKEVGASEEGEILVKGPQVMKGYLNNPTATADTIDAEGWLHTGDIGYCDADGFLFITDRAKDLIKYKGFQVSPSAVEAELLTHPAVLDTAVIGVPDDYAGELPKAYVVLKAGKSVTTSELVEYISGRVAPHKRLHGGVEFTTEIPKSASGKILRRMLKDRERGGAGAKAKL